MQTRSGFVHELSMEEIKEIMDNAIQIKPRRQMSIQFSGGEPTMSPHFIEAVRYARKVGYNSVQAATNGIGLPGAGICKGSGGSRTSLCVLAV